MSETAHDVIEQTCGPVMPLLSKSLRAMFVARPGCVLIGGDFSNIEGRVNAWLAGEDWKLRAFADYDAGAGPDLYKVAYANAFNVPVESVTPRQRQKGGKTQELALGYQGSVGAWLRFDADPTEAARLVMERFHGEDPWRRAADQHDRTKFHNGLAPEQWIGVKVIVNQWREANARITQSWFDRQDAAIEAVDNPGTKVDSVERRDGTRVPLCGGRIAYLVSDGFLWCRLPSGKLLAYARPRLVEKKDDWLVDAEGNAVPADEMSADEIEIRVANGAVLHEGRRKIQVCYDGKDQKTGAWGRRFMYGGNQCNNDVQSLARELLRFAMGNVERAGYPIVLHVHDELVCEVREAFGSVDHFEDLMGVLPPWLQGLPLAAKAWRDRRYVK